MSRQRPQSAAVGRVSRRNSRASRALARSATSAAHHDPAPIRPTADAAADHQPPEPVTAPREDQPRTDADPLPPAQSVRIPVHELRAALDCAARGDVRNYLNGVFVHQSAGQLRIIGTDGHRMIVIGRVLAEPVAWAQTGAIIDREDLSRVLRYLATAPKPKRGYCSPAELVISFGVGHPSMTLEEDGAGALGTFRMRPIDGRFPDYEALLTQAGRVLAAEHEVGLSVGLNHRYMRAATTIADQLDARALRIFAPPYAERKADPFVITFEGSPGALMLIMPMALDPTLPAETVRQLGKSAMAASIAALKAHATRCRMLARQAKDDEREAHEAKASAFDARVARIREALRPALSAPAVEETAQA